MFDFIIATPEFLIGVCVGITFDDLAKRIIATRIRAILGVDNCDAEDDDEADGDSTDTADGKDNL